MTIVHVYEVEPKEKQGPHGPYRADIFPISLSARRSDGNSQHGEGKTPAEALYRAAYRWYETEKAIG